jgi:hypothetical protein
MRTARIAGLTITSEQPTIHPCNRNVNLTSGCAFACVSTSIPSDVLLSVASLLCTAFHYAISRLCATGMRRNLDDFLHVDEAEHALCSQFDWRSWSSSMQPETIRSHPNIRFME